MTNRLFSLDNLVLRGGIKALVEHFDIVVDTDSGDHEVTIVSCICVSANFPCEYYDPFKR